MSERLMLLDSASLYFRAFFGIKETVLAPDGTPVNAVRGFLDMVATLVARRRPDRLVACWDDDWRPAFRVAAIPSYKSHRLADPSTGLGPGAEDSPPGLDVQVPIIVEALAALGITRLGGAGLEADDVIGTLATREVTGGRVGDVDIVTGDRDLFQLVDDAAGVRVLYTGKGVRNLEIVDQGYLEGRYGIGSGLGYAAMAALRGDPSDGLPGVPGIGEKTAAALVSRYGDLERLRAAALDAGSDLSPAVRRRLGEASDYLDVAMTVVGVVRDADLPSPDDVLPPTPPDHDALVAFARRWGLDSPVARVVEALSSSGHKRPEFPQGPGRN
jgi:5'-3' exonuclease